MTVGRRLIGVSNGGDLDATNTVNQRTNDTETRDIK